MSITTKRGDNGETDLCGGGRLPKQHLVFEVLGDLDELAACLTLAESHDRGTVQKEQLHRIQGNLVRFMGEVATKPDQRQASAINKELLTQLETACAKLEEQCKVTGWQQPAGSPSQAILNLARTVCRRAERHLWALNTADWKLDETALIYINRLSDWLWLVANA